MISAFFIGRYIDAYQSLIGGSYYEYTLTDDMLTAINKSGLRISGNAYTLTNVDIIDPAKEYTIISQYDEADIKAWEPGETPKLGMTITNIETIPVTTTYKVTILRDMVDDDTQTHSVYQTYQQEVTLEAGETQHVDLLFDNLTAAGFYKLTANVNNNDVCSYNIGYNPTDIVSESTAPADFWTYWNNAKKELATVEPDIQLEELTDPSNSRAFYSIDGSTTGISGITNAAQADNTIYFSISGMKTTKPQKGIYIHNGKKVVLK